MVTLHHLCVDLVKVVNEFRQGVPVFLGAAKFVGDLQGAAELVFEFGKPQEFRRFDRQNALVGVLVEDVLEDPDSSRAELVEVASFEDAVTAFFPSKGRAIESHMANEVEDVEISSVGDGIA